MIALTLAKIASTSLLGTVVTAPRPPAGGGSGRGGPGGGAGGGGSRHKDLAIDVGQWLLEKQFVTDSGTSDPPGDLVSLAYAIDAVTAALVIHLGVNKLRTGRISPSGWRGYADAVTHALSSAPASSRTPSPVALALSYVITSRVPAPRAGRGGVAP
ncbi:hypothetical protein [Streptomyces sp. MAR4 CNX-425]|uniref:hypothetical protein n=1 Tax=Streptomyces sp. MAR4 CNX-425 TaxID=3406343 RepID=UPI003B5120E6